MLAANKHQYIPAEKWLKPSVSLAEQRNTVVPASATLAVVYEGSYLYRILENFKGADLPQGRMETLCRKTDVLLNQAVQGVQFGRSDA